MERAILHKGFSVIDCMSVCPTYYGRKNRKGDAADMIRWQRDHCIDSADARGMLPDELEDKLIIGETYHHNRAEYTSDYQELIDRCKGGAQ